MTVLSTHRHSFTLRLKDRIKRLWTYCCFKILHWNYIYSMSNCLSFISIHPVLTLLILMLPEMKQAFFIMLLVILFPFPFFSFSVSLHFKGTCSLLTKCPLPAPSFVTHRRSSGKRRKNAKVTCTLTYKENISRQEASFSRI